jgi:hypothetical protein
VTSSEEARPLDVVATALAGFQAAQQDLREAVRAALDDGSTWAEIGAVLGVSRQAASQRFGPKQPRQD